VHLRLHSDEFCARAALYLGVQTKNKRTQTLNFDWLGHALWG